MRQFVLSLVVVLTSVATLSAQDRAVFRGEDGNWFNPRNWSTGQVPGPRTDVVIQDGYRVVIDPALSDDGTVSVRDLLIFNATLTTKPGTKLLTRNEYLVGGSLIQQSTESTGDVLIALNPTACVSCNGLKLNPTPKTKRIVVLQSSAQVEIGLGGRAPAGPGRTGPGHYATLTTDWGIIGGDLKVNLHYGFVPQPGDVFNIIRGNALILGTFNGLREGALVERFGNVGLFISYRGGDGCDVVLTARTMR